MKDAKIVYPLVVSGLPRSGTSMMMAMLSAAGFEILTDKLRKPDANNPRGYYEYEPVKNLQHDNSWLINCDGKVIKIVSPLLMYLNMDLYYKIIFMQRDITEILASQKKMMARTNTTDGNIDELLKNDYIKHLEQMYQWIDKQPNLDVYYINFNDMLQEPEYHIFKLIEFLSLDLEIDPMLETIDLGLYRERK